MAEYGIMAVIRKIQDIYMAVRSAGKRSHTMENSEQFPIISWVSTPEIRQLVSLMDSSDLSKLPLNLAELREN